jgi:hypothetical protein
MASAPIVRGYIMMVVGVVAVMVVPMIVMVIMGGMVMSIVRVAMIGNRTVRVADAAIRQMRMIVVMVIDGKRPGIAAEELYVVRALADHFRRAAAADMAV